MSTSLQIAANVLQIALALALCSVMLKNKSLKRFPWFFFYISYQVCEAIFRWLLFWKGSPAAYYYGYWKSQIFDMAFSFIAIGESWLHIFKGFLRLKWFRILAGSAAGIILACCWLAVWRHPRQDNDWVLATILQLDLTFTFIPVVASIIYFGLLGFFGIAWYRRESGVVLGFMIAHGFSLAAVGFRAVVGLNRKILWIRAGNFALWIPVIGYLMCELIWFLTFAWRVPAPKDHQPQLTAKEINERLGEYLFVLTGTADRK